MPVKYKSKRFQMAAKIRRLKIGVALTVVLSLAIVLLAPSPVVPAKTYEVGTGGIPLSTNDFSAVPRYIVDDANMLATELFGNDQEKGHDFISQLLALYLAAKDKDIVIIHNSGGFGWASVEASPGWQSIINGIKSELEGLGYSLLLLGHLRTAKTLNGCLSELMAGVGLYPPKAKDLEARVAFLTRNISGLRVILTSESNSASICESAIKDNSRVYSIQLGPPFWDNSIVSDRSLVMRSNGIIPDSFSQGDLFTIIRANLEALFGISQDNPGKILLYIGAPGHDYRWEYPEVHSQITNFLEKIFGLKQ